MSLSDWQIINGHGLSGHHWLCCNVEGGVANLELQQIFGCCCLILLKNVDIPYVKTVAMRFLPLLLDQTEIFQQRT